jgi:Rieske Fe-S protein
MPSQVRSDTQESSADRRGFFRVAANTAMCGGLAASYGTLAAMAGRFLYPIEDDEAAWQFVAAIEEIEADSSRSYVAPDGSHIVIARQGKGTSSDDFIALSSICPHLGCQVHWESQHQRFFCPCHNGAFDAKGQAISGPPAKGKQVLMRFPLKIESGLMYILVRTTQVGQLNSEKG